MTFRFYLPTRVFFGEGVLKEHGDFLGRLGRRALVVTGRKSAIVSGAMADFEELAKSLGLSWIIYDEVAANPTLETVAKAIDLARGEKVDLVIGIGGGSPLDTAKAVALLAPNRAEAAELYEAKLPVEPLPMVAIPTTAGTGSEVTQNAVFTLPDKQTKKGFSDDRCFPRVALVDSRYTYTLPRDVTIDTALDALSHAVEGYLSKRSTPLTDTLAMEAIKIFSRHKHGLLEDELTPVTRNELMYASTLAGMVIAHTRTTLLHTLGYPLTYSHDIPHGRANGYLLAAYLEFIQPAEPAKVDTLLKALGMNSVAEIQELIRRLLPPATQFSKAELERMASLVANADSLVWTARRATLDDLYGILAKSLGQ
ncbi:iron-containing alcohol dehydrogenase family protein [Neomoorella humiferrea]|uniref:iron-containing alcohol dehydrogenase family protein n=1 Tax=Neomoorella humiferrea TaxID=676965 RepID=UPI003D8DC664